jgi:hypothetical protein
MRVQSKRDHSQKQKGPLTLRRDGKGPVPEFCDLAIQLPEFNVVAVNESAGLLFGVLVILTEKFNGAENVAVPSHDVHAIMLHARRSRSGGSVKRSQSPVAAEGRSVMGQCTKSDIIRLPGSGLGIQKYGNNWQCVGVFYPRAEAQESVMPVLIMWAVPAVIFIGGVGYFLVRAVH